MVAVGKKVKTFEIEFSDPSKSFYISGDKVAGRIVVEVSEVTRVSAVRVVGMGTAKVEYLKGKERCREEIPYLSYEEVLRLDDQPSDKDGSVILRPGNKYEYTFGFELPQQGQLVSSYTGKFGSVHYFVKALLDRPSQPALECRKLFEVEEPLDVNTPDLMSPSGGMREKKVTCMFIPDGQVSLNAKIDRKGFCEGEEICIDARFENTCSRIVIPKAAIIAKHTYQAKGRTKVFQQKLSSVRGNHIISGMCDAWQGKTIRVPKIKPSILGCKILRMEYFLLIYVSIPGSEKLVLELPLVIGSGSSSGFSSRTNSMSSQDGGSSTASNSWVSLRMPSAPPSYCELPRDCRLDTPLLDDYDGGDSPIFMNSHFQFPSSPPVYGEVEGEYNGNSRMLPVC
ncbi:thioredoxin interacting protein a [Brienomyrus brachyistius]|uniref:thioredoxin interacting protein a n=1 Tax=Brienomyrus brachyistius TaxID=42636 RepID=UPI0020B275C7|nr:thioredoxin interacting protein a [Brienomyrus brachyistius]